MNHEKNLGVVGVRCDRVVRIMGRGEVMVWDKRSKCIASLAVRLPVYHFPVFWHFRCVVVA